MGFEPKVAIVAKLGFSGDFQDKAMALTREVPLVVCYPP